MRLKVSKKKDKDLLKKGKKLKDKVQKPKLRPLGKKGQAFMIDLMILVMAIVIFIALIPALSTIFNQARERDSLNCPNYVYNGNSSSSRSYNSSYESDTLACTILDLGIPYLILGVLMVAITLLIRQKLSSPPEPTYGGYGGMNYPGY